MLKLDLESDQTVSLNWRRVASTHSFQELLSENHTEPRHYTAATAIWGLALTACACTLLCGAVWCLLLCMQTPLAADSMSRHIKLETYYMLLVPLTVPITIAALGKHEAIQAQLMNKIQSWQHACPDIQDRGVQLLQEYTSTGNFSNLRANVRLW